MQPQIILGIWEEVATEHAKSLKGHRVEIRVLDGGSAPQSPDVEAFKASMFRIAEITKDAAPLSPEPLRAEEFYESAE